MKNFKTIIFYLKQSFFIKVLILLLVFFVLKKFDEDIYPKISYKMMLRDLKKQNISLSDRYAGAKYHFYHFYNNFYHDKYAFHKNFFSKTYKLDEVRVGDLILDDDVRFPVLYHNENHVWVTNIVYTNIGKYNIFLLMLDNNMSKFCKENPYEQAFCTKGHIDDYKNTVQMLEKYGYDSSKSIIVIDENNIILDGRHRASWIYWKYGPDYKIKVLRMLH